MTIAVDYKKPKNKYGNKKTVYNNRTFDSAKEAEYAKELDFLRHAKNDADRVTDIEYQPCFNIKVNDKHIAKYYADFRVTYADGRVEVIDVKGKKTAVYSLKKKLVEALHDVTIREI